MGKRRLHILALVLLAGPFYVNDLANIYVGDWRWWLAIDYVGLKLFPLLVVVWLVRSGRMRGADFGLTRQTVPAFLVTFGVLTVVGAVIDQTGYPLMEELPGYVALGGMPRITSRVWDWIDLTFGLVMVGVVEELVFRGYMRTFLRQYTRRPTVIVVASSVAFGLIHWSAGLHAVVITAIIGAVFMVAYLRTRSVPAIMLAHFAVNFIDFAGVIPKSVFLLV